MSSQCAQLHKVLKQWCCCLQYRILTWLKVWRPTYQLDITKMEIPRQYDHAARPSSAQGVHKGSLCARCASDEDLRAAEHGEAQEEESIPLANLP